MYYIPGLGLGIDLYAFQTAWNFMAKKKTTYIYIGFVRKRILFAYTNHGLEPDIHSIILKLSERNERNDKREKNVSI